MSDDAKPPGAAEPPVAAEPPRADAEPLVAQPPRADAEPPRAVDEPPAEDEATRPRGSRLAKWLVLLFVTLLVTAADQGSKQWAHTSLRKNHAGRLHVVKGFFSLTYVRNPGAAWGFLARRPASFRKPFFLVVSLVAVGFILYLFIRVTPGQRLLMVALSLVMGGAVGNFIDRLRFNYVIDFLDVYFGRAFKWPTFNIADVAISVGVVLLFIEMITSTIAEIRQRRAARRAALAAPAPDAALDVASQDGTLLGEHVGADGDSDAAGISATGSDAAGEPRAPAGEPRAPGDPGRPTGL